MIPPYLFFQIYLPMLEQNDCNPPKCGELSEYTDSCLSEMEDLSSICLNATPLYKLSCFSHLFLVSESHSRKRVNR